MSPGSLEHLSRLCAVLRPTLDYRGSADRRTGRRASVTAASNRAASGVKADVGPFQRNSSTHQLKHSKLAPHVVSLRRDRPQRAAPQTYSSPSPFICSRYVRFECPLGNCSSVIPRSAPAILPRSQSASEARFSSSLGERGQYRDAIAISLSDGRCLPRDFNSTRMRVMVQFGKRFVSGHCFSDAAKPFSSERLLAAGAFQPRGTGAKARVLYRSWRHA